MFLFFAAFVPSLFAQAPTNSLLVLDPPKAEMLPTFWEQHGTAMLVAGFVFIALASVTVWMMLRPKPPAIMPPEVLAREDLTRLLNRPEDGKTLSEISQALRRYIIAAFQFPAAELTTSEFSAAVAGSPKIGADLAQSISSFLQECDQRKFALANPAAPLNAAKRALEIVAAAEEQRARLRVQEVKQP